MAWQPTKPLAADQLSNSQSDLQGNFTELDTWSKVNHAAINAGAPATSGMHTFVTFPLQGADPLAPLINGTNFNLFAKLDPISLINQLHLKRAGGPAQPISASGSTNGFGVGYTYLSSTLVIKWGQGTANTPVDMDLVGPAAFTLIFTAQVTNTAGTEVIRISNQTASTLTTVASANRNFQWMAIGPVI